MHDRPMDMHQIDMNLLVVLEVLLRRQSVSAAARELGRSQSAVSHALGRLRDQLDDPVLIRAGHGMTPSPRAEALRAPLHDLLSELQSLLERPAKFDPESARRRFRLSAPDILAAPLPDLLRRLHGEAPHIQVELLAPGPDADLARHVDLALARLPDRGASLRVRRLGEVQNEVVMRRGHAPVRTVAEYLSWPHTFVRTQTADRSDVGDRLAASGHDRELGTIVPGFLQALLVVARTDELFTCPGAVVRPVADLFGLERVPCPVPMPRVPIAAIWHARNDADPAHAWFRERVATEVRSWLEPAH